MKTKTKKTVWIPAIIAVTVAALLVIYYYYMSSVSGGKPGMRPPGGGNVPGHMGGSPGGKGGGGNGEIFNTLGTISVFLGAASFCWFWFKKKLRSPSMLVQKAGKLFHSLHKLLGWATLILIAVHGVYFLIIKFQDHKTYSGLAAFAIILAISGYGFYINKVRNKWMRTIHRILGLLWVPVLLLHVGGTAIMAVIATLAVGGLVWTIDRMAEKTMKPVAGDTL
ncbi:hypothetical protein LK13_12360 [Paenibacillus polymyxa]|uniref:hypothetical protein n=1 Tax=Paenibacillus polymyxa TaxID=1406 RepID=UPI0002D9AE82|nr:hypothetical protein [Paenibacillus polymyxa]AHM68620.1 hypothetical protein PPSQR21_050360 [Paenibacillus polymyxa SQR-21]AIY09326.1 hypothetical protein LK13_12360 [Paenibacillus polymyxa]AUS29289.1 hypothetical protein C1A50_5179 [Paenibacillus polymyxa]KJK30305.1 hypothetical protein TY89_15170 [Paenibacillus polymyxa]MBE3646118.1 hypothetical protein [Paenibacillus polymyxa]